MELNDMLAQIAAVGIRLTALEVRLTELEKNHAVRAPILENLETEVRMLRERHHEMASAINPLVLTRAAIMALPGSIEKLNSEIKSLNVLPAKIDSLTADFLVFKGRISGGLLVASVLAPVLTGVCTAIAMRFLHI